MKQEGKKAVIKRLLSVDGHLKAVIQMVEEDKTCDEILLQLSAVESAIHNVGKTILKNHLESCVKEGIEQGDVSILDKFSKVLDKYI